MTIPERIARCKTALKEQREVANSVVICRAVNLNGARLDVASRELEYADKRWSELYESSETWAKVNGVELDEAKRYETLVDMFDADLTTAERLLGVTS